MPRIQADVDNARKRRRPSARELLEKMYFAEDLRPELQFLAEIITKKKFMAVVERCHRRGSHGYARIELAFNTNASVFRGVYRKTGERYAWHSIQCALIVMLYLDIWHADVVTTMLVHDVTEKERRRWNLRRMLHVFGRWVSFWMSGMTRPKEIAGVRNKAQVDDLYHARFPRAGLVVLILKGVDRCHNTATMLSHSRQEVLDKNDETTRVLLPLLRQHRGHKAVRKLLYLLESTMRTAEERKNAQTS